MNTNVTMFQQTICVSNV